MKETVEIKIGEKVLSVDAIALLSLVSKGRKALDNAAIDEMKRGNDIRAEMYHKRVEECYPVLDALTDYAFELLK